MKITIVAAISIDGKLTRAGDPKIHSWTSEEDHASHTNLIASHQVIVMGRKTYDAWRLKPMDNKLFIIQTRNPEKYADKQVKDQLEFTSLPADKIVSDVKSRGYKEIMVDGGGQVNAEFLAKGLVTDLLITIEPFAFGIGTELFDGHELNAKFKLKSVKQLNTKGSLLLHYQVML